MSIDLLPLNLKALYAYVYFCIFALLLTPPFASKLQEMFKDKSIISVVAMDCFDSSRSLNLKSCKLPFRLFKVQCSPFEKTWIEQKYIKRFDQQTSKMSKLCDLPWEKIPICKHNKIVATRLDFPQNFPFINIMFFFYSIWRRYLKCIYSNNL